MSQNDIKDTFSKDMSLFEKRILSESVEGVRVGWVKKTAGNCCQLSVNPWNNNVINKEKFVIPSDISVHDGEFVEFEVGPPENDVVDIDRRNLLAKDWETYRFILNAKKRDYPQTRPNIKSEDFLNALCEGWNKAESDRLNETIALQILSCPGLNYAIGGLGSESAHYDRLKEPIDRLQKEIGRALPNCMKKENGNFDFQIVRSNQENEQLIRRVKMMASKEISYNYVPSLRKLNIELNINFPTMIKDATIRGPLPEFDVDFYDYLLTAHTYNPEIESGINSKIDRYIDELRTKRLNDFIDYNIKIDPNSITKVGLALCRLEFKKTLDEPTLKKAWNLCDELYNDYFDYLRRTYDFVDLPNGERKRIKEKIDWMNKLSKDEMVVMSAIQDLSDVNKNKVLVSDVYSHLINRIEAQKIESAIEKLLLKGLIYQNNLFEIRIVSRR